MQVNRSNAASYWAVDGQRLTLKGDWIVDHVGVIERGLKSLPASVAAIDLTGLGRLDTAGALLIHHLQLRYRSVPLDPADANQRGLVGLVARDDQAVPDEPLEGNYFIRVLAQIGQTMEDIWREAYQFLGFLGLCLSTMARGLVQPTRLRLTSLVYYVEQTGFNALPIVGLLSFLIGVVMAYQGADQLRKFGAEVFVVNMLGISILRELGVLMTAIIVAGRSGSAFTAQIGSMKLNEEIDAMTTIGLDPVEVLVLPRTLALLVALPLLSFWGDMMALLGGALMCWGSLDLSPQVFLDQLNNGVKLSTFLVGMVKAPVFAILIGIVGCFMGLKVTGSAESVGQYTTRSVVTAIFLVIVADAMFSIFFSMVGL